MKSRLLTTEYKLLNNLLTVSGYSAVVAVGNGNIELCGTHRISYLHSVIQLVNYGTKPLTLYGSMTVRLTLTDP